MIKRMTMLVRRDDLSVADFGAYWYGKHADIARRMPQLHRYFQNHVLGKIGPVVGDASFRVDGIPELWFLNEDAKVAAFQSAAARELPIDEKNFIEGITILSIEETILRPGDGAVKTLLLRRGQEAGPARLQKWCEELTAALPSAGSCVGNRVLSAEGRPGVWREPTPPDLIVEMRFASKEAAEAAFSSNAFGAFAEGAKDRGDAFVTYLVDERVIV